MAQASKTLGRQITERMVRIGIAVVGLLILRGVLSVMPMLRSEPLFTAAMPIPSFSMQNAPPIDQILKSIMSNAEWQKLLEETLGDQRRSPVDFSARTWNDWLMEAHLAVFPITIAKAAVDTLIFFLLGILGYSLVHLFRKNYSRMPDLGQMMNLVIITAVVATAYYSYQGVAYPLLLPDNLQIYGWVFLVLILAPLVGLAVVVGRNMDAITALVMRSGAVIAANSVTTAATTPANIRCGSCGQVVTTTTGAKFCPNCGAAASVRAMPAAAAKVCSSCAAPLPQAASFCGECGQSV